MELLAAARQLLGPLPVEKNAVFAAVQFERGLSEHVLVLAQFTFEFIRASAELLLLAFHLVH